MSRIRITNGSVVLKKSLLKNSSVLVEGAKIAAVGKRAGAKGCLTLNAKGSFVSPGFIDTHIHGRPDAIFANEIPFGTTAIVVTESCAPLKKMGKPPLGPNVLGIRLEGPYINKKRAGAQDIRYIRKPDAKELSGIIKNSRGLLRMMTLAPELKGVLPLIKVLASKGIIASFGHSDATYKETKKAINLGMRHATHIFNGMGKLDKGDPDGARAVLKDGRVAAEVIADLIHVPRALMSLLLKFKNRDKIMLITDSVKAAPPRSARKSGGAYRLKDGRLAGSCLTMIEAVGNMVRVFGLSIPEAVRLATLNPARLLGARTKGGLKAGMDADIVIFDRNFNVKMTMVRGKIVYRRKGF